MKRIIRLTESELHNVISNTVQQLLKENSPWGRYAVHGHAQLPWEDAIDNIDDDMNQVYQMAQEHENDFTFFAINQVEFDDTTNYVNNDVEPDTKSYNEACQSLLELIPQQYKEQTLQFLQQWFQDNAYDTFTYTWDEEPDEYDDDPHDRYLEDNYWEP